MTPDRSRRRRPSSSSPTSTMTGVAPIVTRVARLTEVSDTDEKYAAWNVAASRPVTATLAHAARPEGQRRPGTTRKATMSPPPASSRTAATESGDSPADRPSSVPVRPPVPHSSPAATRQSRGAADGRRAGVVGAAEDAARAAEEEHADEATGKRSSDEKDESRGSGATPVTQAGRNPKAARQPGWLDARTCRPARSAVAG